MEKKPKILANFASLLLISMAILLFYVWINFEELSSDQAERQMRYLNKKNQMND